MKNSAGPEAHPAVGVLGLGRFGRALVRSLEDMGLPVFKKTRQEQPISLADWVVRCEILCLAVRDDQLGGLIEQLALLELEGKTVITHSGITPLSDLAALAAAGAVIGKFHPLQAFSKAEYKPIPRGTPFAMEGGIHHIATPWTKAWGCSLRSVSGDEWRVYHLAAVMAANFLPLFIRVGSRLLKPLASDEQDSFDWLRPLVERSVAAALDADNRQPFSGPAVRGDRLTMAAHEKLLSEQHPEYLEIYRMVSAMIGNMPH